MQQYSHNYCPYCGRNCNCITSDDIYPTSSTSTVYLHSNTTNIEQKISRSEKRNKKFKSGLLYNNSSKHIWAMEDAIWHLNRDHSRKIITYNKNILRWYWKGSGSFRYTNINPSKNFYKV